MLQFISFYPYEKSTEPPMDQTVEPSVYIPVPTETHDVLTQEEIDFEMTLSSFNFDDLTLPIQNPAVIPKQAGMATEPSDIKKTAVAAAREAEYATTIQGRIPRRQCNDREAEPWRPVAEARQRVSDRPSGGGGSRSGVEALR
nr:hypothetical protein Iba_chr09cCG7400 [Ipomoea batatas]